MKVRKESTIMEMSNKLVPVSSCLPFLPNKITDWVIYYHRSLTSFHITISLHSHQWWLSFSSLTIVPPSLPNPTSFPPLKPVVFSSRHFPRCKSCPLSSLISLLPHWRRTSHSLILLPHESLFSIPTTHYYNNSQHSYNTYNSLLPSLPLTDNLRVEECSSQP